MSYPIEKEALRFSGLNINEVEVEVRNEASTHLSWLISALLSAGRINGNGVEIMRRIEDETIQIIREHWVK